MKQIRCSTLLLVLLGPSRADAEESLPAGAIARLGNLRFKSSEGQYFLGFAPDGKRIYTHTGSNVLHVWDADQGKIMQRVEFGSAEEIRALSRDAQFLMTWDQKMGIRLRKPDKAEPLLSLPQHTITPHLVAVSPDHRILAVTDEFGGLRLYDTTDGSRLVSPLPDGTHRGRVVSEICATSLQFTNDGRHLVIGFPSKTPLVWNVREKKTLMEPAPLEERAAAKSLVPGRPLWAMIADGRMKILRLTDMREERSIFVGRDVNELAYSANGKLFATREATHRGVNCRLTVWDWATGKELAEAMVRPEPGSLAFLPDNQRLATVGDRTMRFWRLPKQDEPRANDDDDSSKPRRRFGTTEIVPALVELFPDRAAGLGVSGLVFTPDGQQLLAASPAGVNVWAMGDRKFIQRLGEYEEYSGHVVAVAPDGKTLNLGGGDWLDEGTRWRQGRNAIPADWICRCLAFSPDGKHLAMGSRKTEMFTIMGDFPPTFTVANAEAIVRQLPLDMNTTGILRGKDFAALTYSPDSSLLAAVVGNRYYEANRIAVLDAKKEYKFISLLDFPRGSARCVAFSPNGRHVAVGGGKTTGWYTWSNQPKDNGIAIWPADGDKPAMTLEGHAGGVLALAYSRDGRWIVTGGSDQTIRVWDAVSGQQKALLRGHDGNVTAVAFSADGKYLATGSEDTTVLLWDFNKVPIPGR